MRPSRPRLWLTVAAAVLVVAGGVLVFTEVRAELSQGGSLAASPVASVVAAAGATPGVPPSGSSSASPSGSSSGSPVKRSASPVARPAGSRLFTFDNRLAETLWIAGWQQTPQPALATTGWVLPAGGTLTISVPDRWNGRFWARTGCSFDASGHGRCATGDCAGRFQCRQYGVIPATLAEFNLTAWQQLDFYDVSMVDGSNVPMWINIAQGRTKDPISTRGCSKDGCTRAVPCPPELRVDRGGRVVGCESPCGVFDTDQYCCRGAYAPRDKCRPDQWPVDYAAVFKKAQPFAYSYVDDDATSTFVCGGGCDYRIVFSTS
ncbi:thaumatin family protein [Hamadaea tsunoensis]|uniref:thaumatin family protein n=1 Tax=Hamadaea tsunoensis TaxID=53368 RepID=UPI000427CE73|nr:thaumatin family protein [Hamadaea tsunoensis]